MVTSREKKGRKGRGRSDIFMSFEELWQQVGGGRNQLYLRLKDGTFPTLRMGRLRRILRKPTEAILRGETLTPAGSANPGKVKGARRQAGTA